MRVEKKIPEMDDVKAVKQSSELLKAKGDAVPAHPSGASGSAEDGHVCGSLIWR